MGQPELTNLLREIVGLPRQRVRGTPVREISWPHPETGEDLVVYVTVRGDRDGAEVRVLGVIEDKDGGTERPDLAREIEERWHETISDLAVRGLRHEEVQAEERRREEDA